MDVPIGQAAEKIEQERLMPKKKDTKRFCHMSKIAQKK